MLVVAGCPVLEEADSDFAATSKLCQVVAALSTESRTMLSRWWVIHVRLLLDNVAMWCSYLGMLRALLFVLPESGTLLFASAAAFVAAFAAPFGA